MTDSVALKDVRAEQVAQLQSAIDDNKSQAKQAADQQAAAGQNVKADQAEVAKLQAEASVLRQQLATATMEADQHEIESQLYENKATQREAGITLAGHQDQLAAATQQSQSLAGKAGALQTTLAQANADLSAAEQADAAAANDKTTLTTSVVGAVQEAGSDEVKALVAAASDALAKLVGGANMADVLRARYDHAQAVTGDKQRAVARAQLAALAVAQLAAPNAAAVAAAAARYDDARTSAHRWATKGPGGLAAARQALQQIIGTAAFSAAVSKDVSDRTTAATSTGAAAADKAFHDAWTASIAADADLDAVTGPKAAVDPGYDPAKDDTVRAQRDAAAAADKALTAADAARTPVKQKMIDWDLSLPPDTFALAITTFAAQSQIGELAALDVTTLQAALDATETAYAEALREQARINTLQQASADEQASRQAAAARYAAGADQRVLAIVRGNM